MKTIHPKNITVSSVQIGGITYIVATVCGILSAAITKTFTSQPDLANVIASHQAQFTVVPLLGLTTAGGIFSIFGVTDSFSLVSIVLYTPVALQDMVFAIGLVVKGNKFLTPSGITRSF